MRHPSTIFDSQSRWAYLIHEDSLPQPCKSTNAEHAVVRVYDTETYKPFGQPLQGHILTVTRVAFSPDDRHILTVSRDRSWRLFELQNDTGKRNAC